MLKYFLVPLLFVLLFVPIRLMASAGMKVIGSSQMKRYGKDYCEKDRTFRLNIATFAIDIAISTLVTVIYIVSFT